MTEFSGRLHKFFEDAKVLRNLKEQQLKQVSRYVMPHRGDFNSTTALQSQGVFDTTAVEALKSIAAILTNGLTPPSLVWINGEIEGSETDQSAGLKLGISIIQKHLLNRVFNLPETGFHQQNHQFLKDLVAYGTACMFMERLENNTVFSAIHLEQIYFLENYAGAPDTVFRCYKMTVRQIADKYGQDTLPDNLADKVLTAPHEEIDCVHIVLPKKDYLRLGGGQSKEIKNYDIVSVHMLLPMKHIVATKGYYELPYIISRWDKRTNELYGVGPGLDALPNILAANSLQRDLLSGVQFGIRPVNLVSDDSVVKPESIRPGALLPVEFDQSGRPLFQQLQPTANLRDGAEMLAQIRMNIKAAFFVDRMEQREGTPATATEILDNQQIRISLTGPHINRLETEYLTPMVERAFNLEQRAGALPQLPPEMDGKNIRFKFQSPLAKTQRQQELASLNRVLGATQVIWQSHPDALNLYDPIKLMTYFSDLGGVPPEVIRSPEELSAVMAQQQEQRAAQQELAAGTDASNIIKNLSQANAVDG